MENHSHPSPTIKTLSTAETAEVLGVRRDTLAHWRVMGKGPRYTKIGRIVRYLEHDVRTYLERRLMRSTACQGKGV